MVIRVDCCVIRVGSGFIGDGSQVIRVGPKPKIYDPIYNWVWADVDNYDNVEVLDEFHNGLTLSNKS